MRYVLVFLATALVCSLVGVAALRVAPLPFPVAVSQQPAAESWWDRQYAAIADYLGVASQPPAAAPPPDDLTGHFSPTGLAGLAAGATAIIGASVGAVLAGPLGAAIGLTTGLATHVAVRVAAIPPDLASPGEAWQQRWQRAVAGF